MPAATVDLKLFRTQAQGDCHRTAYEVKQTGHPTAAMLSGKTHHDMFPAQHMQHGAKQHDALYYVCCDAVDAETSSATSITTGPANALHVIWGYWQQGIHAKLIFSAMHQTHHL